MLNISACTGLRPLPFRDAKGSCDHGLSGPVLSPAPQSSGTQHRLSQGRYNKA